MQKTILFTVPLQDPIEFLVLCPNLIIRDFDLFCIPEGIIFLYFTVSCWLELWVGSHNYLNNLVRHMNAKRVGINATRIQVSTRSLNFIGFYLFETCLTILFKVKVMNLHLATTIWDTVPSRPFWILEEIYISFEVLFKPSYQVTRRFWVGPRRRDSLQQIQAVIQASLTKVKWPRRFDGN